MSRTVNSPAGISAKHRAIIVNLAIKANGSLASKKGFDKLCRDTEKICGIRPTRLVMRRILQIPVRSVASIKPEHAELILREAARLSGGPISMDCVPQLRDFVTNRIGLTIGNRVLRRFLQASQRQ